MILSFELIRVCSLVFSYDYRLSGWHRIINMGLKADLLVPTRTCCYSGLVVIAFSINCIVDAICSDFFCTFIVMNATHYQLVLAG